MEDQLVSLETGKIAKEKGFNEKCFSWYWTDVHNRHSTKEGELTKGEHINRHNAPIGTSAPTQVRLQRWLREVHDICVYCVPNLSVAVVWHYKIDKTYSRLDIESQHYQTYEAALEAGLQQSLLIIK